MNFLKRKYFISISTYLIINMTAYAETITWQVNHAPPVTIIEGQYKGQGFLDLILKKIISQLPQYQHHIQVSSMARSIFDLKSNKKVCLPALFATDKRKKFSYFSKSSIAHPSHRIVFNRKQQQSSQSSLSLDELLKNKNYILGLDLERSFGSYIDSIINKNIGKTDIYFRSSESPNQLLDMVKMGRINYTVVYPFKVSYYIQYNNFNVEDFNLYKIEGNHEFVIGRVACPKTDWGRKVIKDVDSVLKKIKPTPEYFKIMGKWWSKEANSPEFLLFYQNKFLKN